MDNRMYKPYEDLPNTALGHYSTHYMPNYLKEMLKGSKYEDIKIVRANLILLKDDRFEEFKVPMDVINRTLDLTKFYKYDI
jgi:hypothetical protein